MTEEANTPAPTPDDAPTPAPEAQAPAQAQEGQQIRLRMDQRDMSTSYANMVATHSMPNEVLLDFGLNLLSAPAADGQPEMIFKVNDRIIMNYYSAKQLAITLGQVIQRHEGQFGELELDVAKRRKDTV